MSIEEKIKTFMIENYMFTNDKSALTNDESFLKKGIIDSTSVLEIMMYLEEEFGVHVEDDEMVAENLDSVNNIVNFISNKKSVGNDAK